MARRTAVDALPSDVRQALDERLVACGFGGYVDLADWLQTQGYSISKSALHRHGQTLELQYNEAMADARAMLALTRAASELGEAGSEIAAGAATILQTDIVRTALEIRRTDDPIVRAKMLAQLTRAQADVGRLSVSVERHRTEVRAKAEAKMAAVEAEAKAMQGESRDVALAMLAKVRAVYEGAL